MNRSWSKAPRPTLLFISFFVLFRSDGSDAAMVMAMPFRPDFFLNSRAPVHVYTYNVYNVRYNSTAFLLYSSCSRHSRFTILPYYILRNWENEIEAEIGSLYGSR